MNRSPRLTRARHSLIALASVAAALGCDSSSMRTAVSGQVTLDGQPLPAGQIVFEPIGTGRMGLAQIVDGGYAMPAEQGPTAGRYRVRITANRPTGRHVKPPASAADQNPMEIFEQYIPAKFNDRSELETEIDQEAELTRNFELTSS